MKILTAAALAGGVSLLAMGTANAAALTGELWLVTDAQAQNAGTVPTATPDAMFAPGAINYQSPDDGSISAFLNNPTFTNQSRPSALAVVVHNRPTISF